MPALEELDMSDVPIGVAGVHAVLGALRFRSLRVAKFENARVEGAKAVLALADVLTSNTSLRSLSLARNERLRDGGVRALLAALKLNKNIVCLDLSACGFSSRAGALLPKWLPVRAHLEELRIDFNRVNGSALNLGVAIAQHKALRVLSVRACNFSKGVEFLFRGVGSCATMKELNVRNIDCNTAAQAKIVRVLEAGKCALTRLNLHSTSLSQACLSKLFALLADDKRLEALDVGGNRIKDDTAAKLGLALASNFVLQELNVSATRLSAKGWAELCRGLVAAQSSALRTLKADSHSKAKRRLQSLARLNELPRVRLDTVFMRDANVAAKDVDDLLLALRAAKTRSPLRKLVLAEKGFASKKFAQSLQTKVEELRRANALCADFEIILQKVL